MTSGLDQHTARDPHDVLGVPRGANRQQVIRAFQRRVRHGGHPDTGGDATTFHELIRARDTLLASPRDESGYARDTGRTHASTPTSRPQPSATPKPKPERPEPRQADSPPPPRTSRMAVATVVLTLLGPLFWPLALAVGLVARHRIKRTGLGGGTVVSVIVFFLCFLTLPVLVRIVSIIAIP